jgi:1,2-diacylglycerol 3-beta-glucosyltransferase
MITALYIVFAGVAIYCLVIAAYLLLITIAAFIYLKPTAAVEATPRIAVLVPAHNEELQIDQTVRALRTLDYPRSLFDVMVISDNSSDHTADFARKAGGLVFERHDPQHPGKGQAIDWLLKTHVELLRNYEILVVVDADTRVSATFLHEMAAMLAVPGIDVVQGAHGVSNPSVNWRTALTTAGFAMINQLRPMGRNALGCTTELNGNGMAFRAQLLLDHGWTAHSVVEDIEMAVQLLLKGHMVSINPDAHVWAEMATTRHQATPQRRRWEGGRFQIMAMYLPRLFQRFMTTGNVRHLDAFLNLLIPPLTLLVFAQLACLALAMLLFHAWIPWLAACLAITAIHVLAGLYIIRAPAKVWLYLAAAPIFLLWKVLIYAGLLVRPRQTQWVRTERNAEIRAKKE